MTRQIQNAEMQNMDNRCLEFTMASASIWKWLNSGTASASPAELDGGNKARINNGNGKSRKAHPQVK